jgi:hypothetical protein
VPGCGAGRGWARLSWIGNPRATQSRRYACDILDHGTVGVPKESRWTMLTYDASILK